MGEEIWPHGDKPRQCLCRVCGHTFYAWEDLDICPACKPPDSSPWDRQL